MGNLKSPRGYFEISTWASNISSEVSFDSSEEFFLPHVGNKKYPRGDLRFSTWISFRPSLGTVSSLRGNFSIPPLFFLSQRGWDIFIPSVWDDPFEPFYHIETVATVNSLVSYYAEVGVLRHIKRGRLTCEVLWTSGQTFPLAIALYRGDDDASLR